MDGMKLPQAGSAQAEGPKLGWAWLTLHGLLMLMALMGALLVPSQTRAADDPPGRVARVAEVQGTAWMRHGTQAEWFPLVRNRPLTTGDALNLGRDGQLTLEVGSSTVLLAGSAQVQIERLDDDRVALQLTAGALVLRLRQPEQINEWRLATPEGFVVPHSTGLFRLDRSERGTGVAVLSGEAGFGSTDSALTLAQGQRAEFWQEGTERSTHYQWVNRAEDELDRLARTLPTQTEPTALAAEAPRIPAEMTGARDLDRYGRWEPHPEYGSVWTPTVVVAGWAPYKFGHWSWVAPWGWTWVDDAPWGFAPFHYGRWVLWSGRWCWWPGAYVARPVWAPALVVWSAPPPPPPPSPRLIVAARPTAGWAPLPPQEPYRPVYPVSPSPAYVNRLNVVSVHSALQQPAPAPATGGLVAPMPGGGVPTLRPPVQPVMAAQPAPVTSPGAPSIVSPAPRNEEPPPRVAPQPSRPVAPFSSPPRPQPFPQITPMREPQPLRRPGGEVRRDPRRMD